ncbi:MAG: hypothetical protein ACLVAO_05410 [Clostridium fessum]
MKIAIITGASSSGMGREAAKTAGGSLSGLQEVWLIARRMDRMQELERTLPIPARCFAIDLTDASPAGDAGKRAGGAQAQRKTFGKCFRLW